jgi:5-methylcytosine-specific restriction endonuclease McrA
MGRKKPYTPTSCITGGIRRIWAYSRERQATLKRDKYTCQSCGKKQSQAKGKEVYVEVHHREPIDWAGIAAIIRERVLKTPDDLVTMCKECHDEITAKQRAEKGGGG